MNLHSPIFDVVRIPPRKSADEIGSAICSEYGIDRTAFWGRHHISGSALEEARDEILTEMIAAGLSTRAMVKWFGREPYTIRRWLTGLGFDYDRYTHTRTLETFFRGKQSSPSHADSTVETRIHESIWIDRDTNSERSVP